MQMIICLVIVRNMYIGNERNTMMMMMMTMMKTLNRNDESLQSNIKAILRCAVLWCNVLLVFPWFSLSFKSKEAMQKSLMRSITTRLVLVQSSIQSFVSFVVCTKTYSIVSFHWIKIVTGNRQNDNRTQHTMMWWAHHCRGKTLFKLTFMFIV